MVDYTKIFRVLLAIAVFIDPISGARKMEKNLQEKDVVTISKQLSFSKPAGLDYLKKNYPSFLDGRNFVSYSNLKKIAVKSSSDMLEVNISDTRLVKIDSFIALLGKPRIENSDHYSPTTYVAFYDLRNNQNTCRLILDVKKLDDDRGDAGDVTDIIISCSYQN